MIHSLTVIADYVLLVLAVHQWEIAAQRVSESQTTKGYEWDGMEE